MMWYSVIESAKHNNLNLYGYLLTELPKLDESSDRSNSTATCHRLSCLISANMKGLGTEEIWTKYSLYDGNLYENS